MSRDSISSIDVLSGPKIVFASGDSPEIAAKNAGGRVIRGSGVYDMLHGESLHSCIERLKGETK